MKTSTPLQNSVQARLVTHARALGVAPNLILARYANERFLGEFLLPILVNLSIGRAFEMSWPPGGPWR